MTTILLTLLLSMAGATASAHDIEVTTDGVTIYYSWTNGNTELAVSYRGTSVGSYFDEYSGNVVIPATVNYEGTDYPVTSIDGAFWYCTELTSVSIPNSVKSIGRLAFTGCSKLSSITIPNSVTSIDNEAFSGCYILTSLTIPKSVTSIGNKAFSNCYALTSIIVEEGNTVFDSRDNCNAIIRTATNTLIAGCQNTTILNSVTSLGGYAFAGCRNLTSVTIPNSVTTIGSYAFTGCI